MALDNKILEKILEGLNKLEGEKIKNFTLSGLSIVEASDIKDYLSNYNIIMEHSIGLEEGYKLSISKNN